MRHHLKIGRTEHGSHYLLIIQRSDNSTVLVVAGNERLDDGQTGDTGMVDMMVRGVNLRHIERTEVTRIPYLEPPDQLL